MLTRSFLVMAVASMAAILFYTGLWTVQAQTSGAAAWTGQVSSKEEGPLEGVLISVKKAGSTVAGTVVSDGKGRYSFPRNKVDAGRYSLRVRAVGYDLENPGLVEVTAQKTTSLDLKLRKTDDLASQLSNAEWLLSIPGTHEQKIEMLGCVGCHSLERIVRSRHSAAEWVQVLQRMNYYVGSTPLRPQRRQARREEGGMEGNAARGGEGERARPQPEEQRRARAEYLSTINLSSVSKWEFPLQTLPRPKGRGTRVIITEYDLPRRDSIPHDAIVDSEGMVWYADFGNQYVGKLDPKTAQVVEYPVPELKKGFPYGMLDVEEDKEGNIWFGMMVQGGIAKLGMYR